MDIMSCIDINGIDINGIKLEARLYLKWFLTTTLIFSTLFLWRHLMESFLNHFLFSIKSLKNAPNHIEIRSNEKLLNYGSREIKSGDFKN